MRLAEPDRSRILLIGAPAYDDERLPNVPEVANNVSDLASLLTHPGLGRFSSDHCQIAPTRASVEAVGDLLVETASEAEDLFLLYYSGHGLIGRNGELYLTLAASRPDRLPFTAINFETIRDACLDSSATCRVIILDCCFSGRAIGKPLTDAESEVANQVHVAGTYTLTAASGNRSAVVLPGERHTAFTGRLLDILNTGIPNGPALLTLGTLYRQLHHTLRTQGLPLPQQRGTETADLLALVANRYRPPGSPPEQSIRQTADEPSTAWTSWGLRPEASELTSESEEPRGSERPRPVEDPPQTVVRRPSDQPRRQAVDQEPPQGVVRRPYQEPTPAVDRRQWDRELSPDVARESPRSLDKTPGDPEVVPVIPDLAASLEELRQTMQDQHATIEARETIITNVAPRPSSWARLLFRARGKGPS